MAKKQISILSVMKMSENDFFDFVAANGHAEQVKQIAARKTEQKKYPKVLKERKPLSKKDSKDEKKVAAYNENPTKKTWQSDKSKTPKIIIKPITFYEVKAAYCEEVLKLAKKEDEKKETWRDRLANL